MENDDDAPRPVVGSTKRARDGDTDADDDEGAARAPPAAGAAAQVQLIDYLRDMLPREMLDEVMSYMETPGSLIRLEQVSRYIQEETQRHWTKVLLQVLAALDYFQASFWTLPVIKRPGVGIEPIRALRDATLAHHSDYTRIPDARRLVVDVLRAIADRMMSVCGRFQTTRRYQTLDIMFGACSMTLFADDTSGAAILLTLAPAPGGEPALVLHVPMDSPLRRRPDLMTRVDTFNRDVLSVYLAVNRVQGSTWIRKNTDLEPLPPPTASVTIVEEPQLRGRVAQFFFLILMDWSPLVTMCITLGQQSYPTSTAVITIGLSPHRSLVKQSHK